MSPQPHLTTVTVAIDRWVGPDLSSTIIGAWSCTELDRGQTGYDVLQHVRDSLGRRWAPATPESIERAMAARRIPQTPWEQISLF